MTYAKILVPVDFSDCSAKALRHALLFKKHFGSVVQVVHAFEVPTTIPSHAVIFMGEFNAPLADHIEREAEQQLNAFLDKMGVTTADIESSLVMMGPPASAVLDLAKEKHHDLIVMGTHGRSGLSRLMLGSVAEKVVRGAHCPVLTIPQDSAPAEVQ